MSTVDLNIISRGHAGHFNWSAERGKITAADLGRIREYRTDNSGAMNALPTPFARYFVIREAFRRVIEEKLNPDDPEKLAGRAYEQLVSDTLDVFELLFNLKWHENQWKSQGRKIIIREWNYDNDLPTLKKNVPVLGNAVASYFSDDLGDSSKKLFFVVLEDNGKEYLLATSSPMTGFVTPPDLDLVACGNGQKEYRFAGEYYRTLDSNPIKRRHRGNYFKDIVLFGARNSEFKNYLYNKLFSNGSEVNELMSVLRNYVQAFESDPDIVNSWSDVSLKEVTSDDNNPVKINGLQLYYADGKDEINYLSDVLVRLPFSVNADRFAAAESQKENSGYSYMLPLTRDGLLALHSDDLKFSCNEKSSAVEVDFRVGEKLYKKVFLKEKNGYSPYVLNMESCKINLDMAVFPNVLSPRKDENNYFKVLVAVSDGNENRTFSVDDVNLEFFALTDDGGFQHIAEADGKDYSYGVRAPSVRSVQGKDIESGTKYYEVFNTRFDAIEVTVNIEGMPSSFFVLPKWDKANSDSSKAFTYAVDLGTSNTYISRREKGKFNAPQQLKMDNVITNCLQSSCRNSQKKLVSNIEDSYPSPFKTQFMTEFVPPLIDGDVYKFPIRTALCVKKDVSSMSLFDNSNIAFFYERMKCPSNHTIKSNLKWADDESSLRVFIREILLLIKADILQENGSVPDTEIVWFRPLSFNEKIKILFTRIWKEEAVSILCLTRPAEQIKCYTESEAPYYYFDTKSSFSNRQSVAVLDIGGGTADVVYYSNGSPAVANSVRFGCDVLWGDGFNRMTDSKANGIYEHYKNDIKFSDESLSEVYLSMIAPGSEASSKDIINLWINNDGELHLSDKFRIDFLPLFVYHYVALLHYMMTMFKVNGLKCPRTLIFSGNGSRYIDDYMTSDVSVLEEITEMVAISVYGISPDRIEIILPEERKESTCYGGLYHKDGVPEPKSVVYVGDGDNDNFTCVEELKKAYEKKVRPGVVAEVNKMNEVFFEVMRLLMKKALSEYYDIDVIKKVVTEVIQDSLDTNYQKTVVDGCCDNEPFNDTLFFYPVIQGLFKLTKECPKAKTRK